MIKVFKIPNYSKDDVIISQYLDYEFGAGNWNWGTLEESVFLAADSGDHTVEMVSQENWTKYKKPVIHFHLTHLDEGQDVAFNNWLKNIDKENTYILSELVCRNPIENQIYTQWPLTIFRAYHIKNYPHSKSTRRWYFKNCNVKNTILDADKKTRIFLCAAKTHKSSNHRKCLARRTLVDLLKTHHISKGHIGNSDDSDLWLADNSYSAQTIEDLCNITKNKEIISFGKNYPHILYFQDTFISLYGETIEGEINNDSLSFTEKTIVPLAQGHFILPFSVCGYIDYLKSLGFRFPTEIDYSYDLEPDYQTRINLYVNEVNRLLSKTIEDWRNIWNKNLDIIEHNRSLIWDSSMARDNLLEKIGINNVI
jgi:hypothetical protein